MEPGRRQGFGRPVEQLAGAAGKDPLCTLTSLSASGTGSVSSRSANDVGLAERQADVDGARMENYWDRKTPLPKAGPIQLQTHGGEIRWRNIFIRELPAEEANALLASRAEEASLGLQRQGFDGLGRPGGELRNHGRRYRLQAQEGRDDLHEATYADFVVRLEFKLPPGGNNGLAIRYPGEGDTAYDGMTELQVLDTEARHTRNSIRARSTDRPTAWPPPTAATCGPSANGTSKRSR